MDDHVVLSICVAIVLMLLTALMVWLMTRSTPSNTLLLLGLTDSGKTLIFSQLITGSGVETFSSMEENEFPSFSVEKGRKKFRLVDFPGAARLRNRLQTHWMGKEKGSLRGLIFVVDSGTLGKRARDVAEFLYEVLYDSPKRVPILIACNKQDLPVVKSSQAIKSSLEREIELINSSQEAVLAKTDGGGGKRQLTDPGKQFDWTQLKRRVAFVECSSVDSNRDYDLSPVRRWIASL